MSADRWNLVMSAATLIVVAAAAVAAIVQLRHLRQSIALTLEANPQLRPEYTQSSITSAAPVAG